MVKEWDMNAIDVTERLFEAQMKSMMMFDIFAREYQANFLSPNRLAKSKDWRPFRFCIENVVLSGVVIKRSTDNTLLVDICHINNPDDLEPFSGSIVTVNTLICEAFKSGTNLEIRFTTNVEGGRIPLAIVLLAERMGISFQHANKGVILPAETRLLYLGITTFTKAAFDRVVELHHSGAISAERICFMVQNGIWDRSEVETILLGHPTPEDVLLGKHAAENRVLFHRDLAIARIARMSKTLERLLMQREYASENGDVVEIDSNDKTIAVEFDPSYYAKIYRSVDEEFSFPSSWLVHNEQKSYTIPRGDFAIVRVVPRGSGELRFQFQNDLDAFKKVKDAITSVKEGFHFFMFVTDDFNYIPPEERAVLINAVRCSGITLLVIPQGVRQLDTELMSVFEKSRCTRNSESSQRSSVKDVNVSSRTYSQTVFISIANETIATKKYPWYRADFDSMFRRLTMASRRSSKGVRVHNERLNCARIDSTFEDLAFVSAQQEVANASKCNNGQRAAFWKVLDDDFATCLKQWEVEGKLTEQEFRILNATVIHTKDVSSYRNLLEKVVARTDWSKDASRLKDRITLIRQAEGLGEHLFLFSLNVVSTHRDSRMPSVFMDNSFGTWSIDEILPRFSEDMCRSFQPIEQEHITDNRGLDRIAVVRKNVKDALYQSSLERQVFFNPTNVSNDILSQVLWDMYFATEPLGEGKLSIVYDDGSMAEPFVVRNLSKETSRHSGAYQEMVEISIGLVSERHSELDFKTHVYWFLNFEISGRNQATSEADAFCCKRSKEMFQSLREVHNYPVRLRLYQTGFPVAIIAFYRTFIQELLARSRDSSLPALELVPMYFKGLHGEERLWEEGKVWKLP